MKTIRKGSKGIEVEFLKYQLRKRHKGTFQDSDVFEPRVEGIVKEIQKANRLIPDGVVGNKTWEIFGIRSDQFIVGKVKHINIHCSATPENKPFGYSDIYKWHVTENGWSDVAYAEIIGLDTVWYTRNELKWETSINLYDPFILNTEKTFGVKGHNNDSIDICYIGGMTSDMKHDKDTMTEFQTARLKDELKLFILHNPDVLIGGHNQFSKKACPSFDVPTKLRAMGIPEKNIYKGN